MRSPPKASLPRSSILPRSGLTMKAPCSVRSLRLDVASSCTRRHAPADSEPRSQPLLPNVAFPRCSRQWPGSPAMTPSSRWHASSNTTCLRSNASSPGRARCVSSARSHGLCPMRQFTLPDLGEGLEEAEIVTWYVNEGDHVVIDQPLVSVETDKAVVEIPSPSSGRIAHLFGATG